MYTPSQAVDTIKFYLRNKHPEQFAKCTSMTNCIELLTREQQEDLIIWMQGEDRNFSLHQFDSIVKIVLASRSTPRA